MGETHGDGVRSLHAWLGRVHPDDVGSLMAALDRHITGETPQFMCEHRVRTRKGAFRWVVASAVVERDGNGRPTVLAGTLADVTERN
ncbi:PAS domain-containing protein, partial [Klebsiella pneumoniae]|uniref:PAS domain-containing protein n=1 Tax=Klebsiella pneumoniae TaxID=573 RepID=UPI0022709800